jgi:hypothetical protein
MKPFAEVAASLQVGTRRSPVASSGFVKGWAADSPEKAAIVEAGVLNLMRRAGANASTSVLPTEIAPDEDDAIARASAEPLLAAIDLNLRDVVLEWARTAARRDKVAPYSALQRLIEWVPRHPKELAPILGARGRWLAQLMEIQFDFPTATASTDDHRAWLQAEWIALDWKQRLDGLNTLAADMKDTDESLLATALSDRRKEVREFAAKCLAKWDGSSFTQEVHQSVKGRVFLERKLLSKKLSVYPPDPEELPKSLPRTPSRPSFGVKAHALHDLLCFVRPSFWETETGLPPGELIALAEKTDYAEALIQGWIEAATTVFLDQSWADSLFKHFAGKRDQATLRRLAPLASRPVFEAEYSGRLSGYEYVPMRGQRFTPAFSKLVVEAVRQEKVVVDDEIERCLDLSVLQFLREPWESKAEAKREKWYRSLDLRKRLLDSLDQ